MRSESMLPILTVIAIYDLSLFCNGKAGFLFTDEKLYCSQVMDKPERIYYTDIVGITDDKEPYKMILNGGKEVPIFNTVVKEHLKYLNEVCRAINCLHIEILQ